MARKRLGIIGKGDIVTDFFVKLHSLDELAEEISHISFCSAGRYATPEDFAATPGYQTIQQTLKQRLPKITLSLEGNFVNFFLTSDIILDASADYRPPSLLAYAKRCIENRTSPEEGIHEKEDYCSYQEQQNKNKQEGKMTLSLSLQDFARNWQLSLQTIRAIKSIHPDFALGDRTFDEFPFHLPMIIERARSIEGIIQNDPRYVSLPTYLNLVNEPCLTSSLIAGICPKLTPFLVAMTGHDFSRLERDLNDHEKIKALKEKENIPGYQLRISGVAGWHDTGVMIPYIDQSASDPEVSRIFHHFDSGSLYRFLQETMGRYWDHHQDDDIKGGTIDRRGTHEELLENLLKTIIAAARSREKGLSTFPEEPLWNGYFQPVIKDHQKSQNSPESRESQEKQGLFLMGPQTFVAGMVHPESRGENVFAQAERNAKQSMREVMSALQKTPAQIQFPRETQVTIQKSVLSGRYFIVAGKERIRDREDEQGKGKQYFTLRAIHDGQVVTKKLAQEPTSLSFFTIGGRIPYAAVGHLAGIEIISLAEEKREGEYPEEFKHLLLSREYRSSGIRSIHLWAENGVLRATQGGNVFEVPLESLLERSTHDLSRYIRWTSNSLSLGSDSYSDASPNHLRAASGKEGVYFIMDQKLAVLRPGKSRPEDIQGYQQPLSAIVVQPSAGPDAQEKVFVGTQTGQIYSSDGGLYADTENSSVAIAKLQAINWEGQSRLAVLTLLQGLGSSGRVGLAATGKAPVPEGSVTGGLITERKITPLTAFTALPARDFWFNGQEMLTVTSAGLQVLEGKQQILLPNHSQLLLSGERWKYCGGSYHGK